MLSQAMQIRQSPAHGHGIVREKLPALESWWKKTYGYGFEGFTDSEAKYLARFNSVDAVRDRIAPAGGAQEGRSNARDHSGPEKAKGGGVDASHIDDGDQRPLGVAVLAALHGRSFRLRRSRTVQALLIWSRYLVCVPKTLSELMR
ncbi:hypothetical protein [Bradyrhizobium cenepequi]|uniref:hypothetical protein n=1 Tax=Bradyrhizobium cenepequi TaxID=2821403 RepID=UPI001CE2472F|nr:hypothetical protein [Bradyrhizobium cenepequi]MCA6111620.1 hypothetical protein [Bradyrhizobium cenepequi]